MAEPASARRSENPITDHQCMKMHNQLRLLRAVRESGPLFRRQLREASGLSWATIAGSVTELLETGLLTQLDKVSTNVGRRPSRIDLDTSRNHILGLRLGSTSIRSVLMDLKGRRLADGTVPLAGGDSADEIVSRLLGLIDTTLERAGCSSTAVAGIGVAVPGAVDIEAGVCLYAPHQPHLRNVPLKSIVEDRFGPPCFLDHVNNCAVLGEKWFGIGRDYRDFLCVLIGTGISVGIMIQGRVYRGLDCSAGELGHVSLDPEGPLCACGQRGCLEVYASGHAIARAGREAALRRDGPLRSLAAGDVEHITAQTVYLAALRGDDQARAVFRDMGHRLGLGISSLINLFNPECIIVSGGVARASELFMEEVLTTADKTAWAHSARKLLVSNLEDGPTLGAAATVLQAVFEDGLLLKGS